MGTGKLTTVKLKSIGEKDLGTILTDGGGLRGRVRKDRNGSLTIQFEYRYRTGPKYRTAKVCNWPDHSLAEIRTKCSAMKLSLSEGVDPLDDRRNKKLEAKLEQAQQADNDRQKLQQLAAEAATRRSLSDALSEWHRLELSRRKDGGAEALRAIAKDILPTLGQVALIDIRRSMLVDALDQVVARGSRVMANLLFGDLKQFFNFAIAREWVEIHPLAGLTKERIGGRQKERERFLSEKEILELHDKLPTANFLRQTEIAIWIMLGTCCRIGELSKAQWEDVHIDEGYWLIPPENSKNGKGHTVFLSTFTQEQFQKLQPISLTTGWCLPSREGDPHINPKSITKQIKDRTRITPLANRSRAAGTLLLSGGAWTPHDLRRTSATLMGELGVMGEVIERCLNHVEQNKLKRIYQRHELKDEQQEAWRLLGERLSLIIKNENNIIPLSSSVNRRQSHRRPQ